jgi:ribonucleoside-triphosphate reductase
MSTKALSDYTFVSRYARYNKELGRRETWHEAIERVKNMHLTKFPMVADEINFAFEHVHNKVALGSQRALQFGGTPILKKEARIYNCSAGYCDRPSFFQEAIWLLLCGCGVGVSVTKNHVDKMPNFHNGLKSAKDFSEEKIYEIEDSIEGWADAFGVLLASYLPHLQFHEYYGKRVSFNYSKIRPQGSPLSYGIGKAPGPKPLENSLEKCRSLMNNCLELNLRKIRPIDCMDYLLHASDCVLSGGIRRSAVIVLFSKEDNEMMTAKTGSWYYENPQRARSNNSVLLDKATTTFEEYHKLFESTKQFGEPGIVWTDCVNEQLFNPCNEISLRGYDEFGNSGFQFCNLTEINGSKLTSKENFALAVRVASIIGTLQSGYTKFDYLGSISESITKKESLLGVSITGMMDNPKICFDPSIQREMAGLVLEVNADIANKIGINLSARSTTVKPAGTTSCILQTSSGIHPHHAERYIRRVQSNAMENPIQHFSTINPSAIETSVWSANGTDKVISFLIETHKDALTKANIDAIQLLEYVKLTQENWIESGKRKEICAAPWLSHNVSNTINVHDHEWSAVESFIYDNRKSFAGISLLGSTGDLDYPQAPFTRVLTVDEIVIKYGKGCIFASGLIVDALHAFHNNLWRACDAALGVFEVQEPKVPEKLNDEIMQKLQSEWVHCNLQKDWVRRAKQFAERHLQNNVKELTYLLKDINNNKLWEDLSRVYKDVDYTAMYEEEDNTKLMENVACAGGACQLF